MFLLITSLDITDAEISILRPIYEETKKNNQYTIVWIPIVDQWTDELKAKFETLCSKMPWYIVQYFSPISGIRFIKEEWQFKGKPIVVGLSPQGKVENPNALYLIKVWGVKAFPFDKTIEDIISKEKNWIGPVVNNIDPIIQTWVRISIIISNLTFLTRLMKEKRCPISKISKYESRERSLTM